ncbi:MAG: hypothetical protein AAF726_11735 [Planctomycetota bacterium]
MPSIRRILSSDFGSYGHKPFVLLYTPRTGSNLLAALLDSHPDVLCHHELFNPEAPHPSLSVREGAEAFDFGTAAERDAAPDRFLDRVYGEPRGAKAVGFKLCINDSRSAFWGLLFNRSVKKVFLTRNNTLESLVSSLIAEKTRTWIDFARAEGKSDPEKDAKKGPETIEIDLRQFRGYTRKRRVYGRLMRSIGASTGQSFTWLDFQDIVARRGIDELLTELGVPPGELLRERTRRQNPAPLRDKISNYDEVCRALAGTRDAWMIEEAAGETPNASTVGGA